MNSIVEVLYARRPIINYVTPSACEPPIASTGIALLSIFLPALFTPIGQMGRPVIFGTAPGPFFLSWENYPGAICYNVYQVVNGQLVLLYECVTNGPIIVPPGEYVTTPVTPEGEGPPSPPNNTGNPEQPQPPEPPVGGNFGPCVGGWAAFSTMITPNQVTTWFGSNTNFSAGTYKIVVELDSNFAGEPPCLAVQFPEGYTAEWNDGTQSALDPYNTDFTCYATVEDMFATTPPPYDFIFVHSGGKIGVNPNGNDKLKFSLHLQCGGGGGEPPSGPCEETGDDTTCAYGPTGDKYRIVGYNEGLFDSSMCGLFWTNCVNCEVYGDPHPEESFNCVDPITWAGTFPVKVNDGYFIEQEFEPSFPCGGCPWPPAHLFHGYCMGASLRNTNAGAGFIDNSTGCGWQIQMFSYTGHNIWTGIKRKGEGPEGIYNRVSGCSPTPECMTLEAY